MGADSGAHGDHRRGRGGRRDRVERGIVEAILPACLDSDFADSQDFGEFWRARGVQAIVYPSAVPGLAGTNIVVFRDAAPQPAVVLVNRDRIIEELRRLSGRLQL